MVRVHHHLSQRLLSWNHPNWPPWHQTLATLQPILQLAAPVLSVCLNPAMLPGAPATLKSLRRPKGKHWAVLPSVLSRRLSFHLLSRRLSITNSNFLSSMRFHFSLLPSEELTPPSFVPEAIITDLTSHSPWWVTRRQSPCLTDWPF